MSGVSMPIVNEYSDGTGIVAYALRDADGTVVSRRNSDVRMYAASTIKLAVAMAVIKQVDAGSLSWDETIPATHEFESGVGGRFSLLDQDDEYDKLFPAVGTPMSIRDLLEIMIDRSSNEATDMLLERIGLAAVQELCRECDMSLLHIERLIGDIAARAQGRPNEVTADELSALMLQAVHGDWTSREHRDVLRGALSRQVYPVIADELPAGTYWGSKSGSVTGIEHDCAFIGDPDGDDLLVLAVCTRGYEERPAQEIIRTVADAVLTPYFPRIATY